MANQILLGLFENVNTTADVLDELRRQGINDNRVSVMSNVPYAPKILGRKPPRQWFLPFVVLGLLGGLAIGLFIVVGTSYLYPIHVGGQGLTPIPPSIIIIGEFLALGVMVMGFIGFLLQNKFPILRRQMYDPRISQGYIGVEVMANEDQADTVADVFRAHHAYDVVRDEARRYPPLGQRHLLFWALVAGGALTAVLIPLLLTYRIIKVPWIDVMNDSPAIGWQEGPRRAVPEGSVPVTGPRLIADQPATERLESSPESVQRGGMLFAVNCQPCHGTEGSGNGMLKQYFPEAPALNTGEVQEMAPDDLYLIITHGRNRMPSMREHFTPGETWDVVNYLLSLTPSGGESGGEQ